MSDRDQQIRDLVTQACQHPPGSLLRQRYLTQVIRLVTPRLWREAVPYYPDALQKTWLYFCKNICNGYDPTLGSVPTWLNAYLKRRLQDGYNAVIKKTNTEVAPVRYDKDGEAINVIETVPDRRGDVEPLWEKVRDWAEADPTGELRQIHIKGHPEVNCQVLILRRLLSETSWQALADEYGIAIPTLSSFYRRQCMPRLRNFGETEGYIQ